MRKVEDEIRSCNEEGETTTLVVQGGGMRGVYSMGALAALTERGLENSFRYVVGSSGGAINGAYFLAGQAKEAVSVYTDVISNKKFINPLRLHRIVDVDFLVDIALAQRVPLDTERVKRSEAELHSVVTDADLAEAQVFTNRDDVDTFEVIRATAALPALYNRKVKIGDRLYIDGGITENFPLQRAINLGSTAILSVVTRPEGYRGRKQSFAQRSIGRIGLRGQSRAVKVKTRLEDSAFNEAMDLLDRGGTEGVQFWTVRPSNPGRLVGRTTSDRKKLIDCAEMGMEDMNTLLDGPYA